MKKLIIYKTTEERDSETNQKIKAILRTVTVDSSFIGIGKKGTIIPIEFKKLARDLEPEMDSFLAVDL